MEELTMFLSFQELVKKKKALIQMAELNEEKDSDHRFQEKEQALKNERKRRQDVEQRLEETEKKLRRLEKSKPKEMKEQQDENGEEKEIRVSELKISF